MMAGCQKKAELSVTNTTPADWMEIFMDVDQLPRLTVDLDALTDSDPDNDLDYI